MVPRALLLLVFCCATLLMAPSSRAETLRLAPGDTIRLIVAGLPGTEFVGEVGADGTIRLGWFGAYVASGKTADELLADVQSASEGRIFKRYSGEGQLTLITVRPEDVFLDVLAYQPVTIGGDVMQPGEFAFRTNLTLRRLLALAGGVRLGPANELVDLDPVQILRLQNDHAAARLDRARARLELWRLSAELEERFDAPIPDVDDLGVSEDIAIALVAEQRELLSTAAVTLEGQRHFLARALEQAEGRVQILLEQQVKLEESLQTDEEEEARIRELLESGLAMASRSSDARRATILSATRLLDVEADLARAKLDVTRLTRDKAEFEQTRTRDLSVFRDNARNALLSVDLRLEGINTLLASQGLGGIDGVTEDPPVSFTVYRVSNGQVLSSKVTMDELLFPGDVIEVHVEVAEPR
jgi:polysaccharide export outer membrane protein